jgi:hypothetical protein
MRGCVNPFTRLGDDRWDIGAKVNCYVNVGTVTEVVEELTEVANLLVDTALQRSRGTSQTA